MVLPGIRVEAALLVAKYLNVLSICIQVGVTDRDSIHHIWAFLLMTILSS